MNPAYRLPDHETDPLEFARASFAKTIMQAEVQIKHHMDAYIRLGIISVKGGDEKSLPLGAHPLKVNPV